MWKWRLNTVLIVENTAKHFHFVFVTKMSNPSTFSNVTASTNHFSGQRHQPLENWSQIKKLYFFILPFMLFILLYFVLNCIWHIHHKPDDASMCICGNKCSVEFNWIEFNVQSIYRWNVAKDSHYHYHL